MTAPTWTTVLGRYGEIGVKSQSTRARFVDQLLENVEAGLDRAGVQHTLERERGRFYVHTPDPEDALEVLQRTFGVVSASPVTEVPPTVEAVADQAAEVGADLLEAGDAFAIRSRRAGDHDFTSMDVARQAGDRVLEAAPDAHVDLDDPDHEIHAEVRPERAFVFTEVHDGPGGLPRGTQGTVLVPVETPRDALAAWTLRKRGCTIHALSLDPLDPALESALEALARWAPVPLTLLPGEADTPEARRTRLLAAAAALADDLEAQAVAVGDTLDEAADWTPLDALADRPVFRPLVGHDRAEVRDLARTVGLDPDDIAAHHPAEPPAEPPEEVPTPDVDAAKDREVTP